MLDGVGVLVFDRGSDDGFILRELRSRLIEFHLETLFGQHWSDYVLFVVNVPWSHDSLFPILFLNNWLSFNPVSLHHFVWSRHEADFDIFLLNNRLDDGLTHVLVCGKRDLSGVDILVIFRLLVNGLESFLHFSAFNDIELFGDFIDFGLDDSLKVGLVSLDGKSPGLEFAFGLNWELPLSLDNFVLFWNILRNQLLYFLVDLRLNHDSLSKRLHIFLGDYLRLSHDSLSDDFWVGLVPLSDDFRLCLDVSGNNLGL